MRLGRKGLPPPVGRWNALADLLPACILRPEAREYTGVTVRYGGRNASLCRVSLAMAVYVHTMRPAARSGTHAEAAPVCFRLSTGSR